MKDQTHHQYAAYLRRLANDYNDAGSLSTADDLNEAADRIEELAAAKLSRKTRAAIEKYGMGRCVKAYRTHTERGEGAYTVGQLCGLTTQQADAAINAGREITRGE